MMWSLHMWKISDEQDVPLRTSSSLWYQDVNPKETTKIKWCLVKSLMISFQIISDDGVYQKKYVKSNYLEDSIFIWSTK